MTTERNSLPGHPATWRIKAARRQLRQFGISPKPKLWYATWLWAHEVAGSYLMRKIWPTSGEVAAQYVVLLLVEMKQDATIHLPTRATKRIPDIVRTLLGGQPPAGLPAPEEEELD